MRDFLLVLTLVGVATVVPVLGNSPPSIKEPAVQTTQYIPYSLPVTLKCKADGVPSYKWEKDGKTVSLDDNIKFDSISGVLEIKEYKDDYDGEYRCIASVDYAASMSQAQTLKEARLTQFKPSSEENKREVTEYDYVQLECANKGLISLDPQDISYNWYWTDKSKQVNMDNGRMYIDLEGNLHFTYIKALDVVPPQDVYLCGYSSVILKVIYLGTYNRLAVNKVTDPKARKPTYMATKAKFEGKIGSETRLECFFSGYDPAASNNHLPVIMWFDSNNREITNSDKHQLGSQNRTLTVKSLMEEDDKNFFCQGFSSVGNSNKISIHLNVTSRPIWVQSPSPQTKSEKGTAVFHCSARSLSNELAPSRPEWYINGKPVDRSLDHTRYMFSADNKMLTISKLRKSDILCLQCFIRNSVGTLMGDACLNVLKPIVVTTRPSEQQRIKKGDIVQLTVKAETDPYITDLRTEWEYKEEKYPVTKLLPFSSRDPNNDNYTIDTGKLSQEDYESIGGLYRCRVYHLYDEVFVDTEVVLTDIVPAAVASSAGFDMWIIGLIIGIIFLLVVIAIIIFVICRKKQEGDYNVDKKETGAGLDPEKELRDKGFNDLSRPDYNDYDYPEKKPRGDLEYDDVPIGGDDESLGEYGDEEDLHFNEDGSFIGIYQKKENPYQNTHHKAESTI